MKSVSYFYTLKASNNIDVQIENRDSRRLQLLSGTHEKVHQNSEDELT